MSSKHRLIFLILSLAILLVVGGAVTGSFQFLLTDFWFSAGLLLLILLSIVDQPHFSRDANIFVNGVAGLVSLVTVEPSSRSTLWYIFLVWTLYLVAASYFIMLVRSKELAQENVVIRMSSRLNRLIGRPKALFSAFFLWGIFTQFGENSTAFKALLLYWAIFMILNVPAVAEVISSTLEGVRTADSKPVGIITAFYSPRVFECRLRPDSSRLMSGKKMVIYSGDGAMVARATVIDDRVLPGARFAKLAVTESTSDWPRLADDASQNKTHISFSNEEPSEEIGSPVGVVDCGTEIGSLSLLINPQTDLQEGEVLRVDLADGRQAFYQIVSARITQEAFEASQGMQHIHVTASQLGLWHVGRSRFEPVQWVAPAGGLVFKVVTSEEVHYEVPNTSVELGKVPNSSFPVHLHIQDAVTHNTAIVGVTGSGKSYLAFHLIEAFEKKNIRVLILDLSRQHWIFLEDLDPFPVKSADEIATWWKSNKLVGIHQFADAISYPRRTADLVAKVFEELATSIQLRAGENEPARICIVLEEAHSLIPEWNQVATSSDQQQVNKTARTILQGRKYGLGCLLITQRTANVTKTILNQCNTIFALQSFDQTGLDFLKNYMGEAYAHAISTLPVRHAILVGKASSSTRPILFSISDFGKKWGVRSLSAT